MFASVSSAGAGAIEATDRPDSSILDTDRLDSDDSQWFAHVVRRLLPKDAGLAIHIETGFEERSCYRYAAGVRAVPSYLFRKLLRGPNGWQWLCGAMDGADAAWWIELQCAREICSQFKIEPRK